MFLFPLRNRLISNISHLSMHGVSLCDNTSWSIQYLHALLLYSTETGCFAAQNRKSVFPVQTEMSFLTFWWQQMMAEVKRLMGKYFHNIFVLFINSKNALEVTRENASLRRYGSKLKNAGMRKRLYHSPHLKILNVRPLTSTTTVIYFRSILNKCTHAALLVLTAHCCLLV